MAFWTDLNRQTDIYDAISGNQYNWRIGHVTSDHPSVSSGQGLHPLGRAVDIHLYRGNQGLTINDRFKPEYWQILEILRATAQAHNLEWGGLYRNKWDAVHVEDQPYNPARNSWWFELAPVGASRWGMR